MALLEDILFSEEFLFEGEQAEEYKERKNKEKEDERNNYIDRYGRRYGNIDYIANKPRTPKTDKEAANRKKKYEIAKYKNEKTPESDFGRKMEAIGGEAKAAQRKFNFSKQKEEAEDAERRHMRRHPKQYKESAELYNGQLELI